MSDNWKEITDPEELFRLKREGWEIEFEGQVTYEHWLGDWWNVDSKFRARPRQPKMNKVTILGWVNRTTGATQTTGSIPYSFANSDWIRYPKLDDEIEVPDEQ